jgi:hypothetical protein
MGVVGYLKHFVQRRERLHWSLSFGPRCFVQVPLKNTRMFFFFWEARSLVLNGYGMVDSLSNAWGVDITLTV